MKTTLLLSSLFAIVCGAQADTINLDSSAFNTTNNSGYATVNISKNPAWANALPGSSWISFDVNGVKGATTGDPSSKGYVVVPNGTSVVFSEDFNLNGTVTSADLSVLADDTTSVIVNGTTIFNATNWGPKNNYATCSNQQIGCLKSTEGTFNTAQLAPYLKTGENTISFDLVQRNAVSYGLDYAGKIVTDPPCATPEPASLLSIGAGLSGLALFRRKRVLR